MAYQRNRISNKLVDAETLKERLESDKKYSEMVKEYDELRKERTLVERKARNLEESKGVLVNEEIKVQKTRHVYSTLAAKLTRVRRLLERQTNEARIARMKRNKEIRESANEYVKRLNTIDGRLRMLEHNTGSRKAQIFREIYEEESTKVLQSMSKDQIDKDG